MPRRVWVTADTHFGDTDAIVRFGRPFPDVQAMDEAMLESINARVDRGDVLLHLGGHRAAVADALVPAGRDDRRRDGVARLGGQAIDHDGLALANPVLLAPEGDDGVISHVLLHVRRAPGSGRDWRQ